MIDEKDKEVVLKKFQSSFDETNKGLLGTLSVIKYLYNNNCEVCSKEISDKLNVSSARMTILLKKLEKENIIIKEQSKNDARSINIKLTEYGIKKSRQMEESFHIAIEKLLDIYSVDQLCDLLDNLVILRNVLKENIIVDLKEENK